MENTTEIIFDKLVYSCAFESYRGHEEFIPDHFLGFQISGETHAFHEHGKTVIKEKTVVLVKKNQLIRTIKYPSAKEKYQFISITLDDETLRQYAAENKIVVHTNFPGDQRLFFEPDDFFKSYFASLIPYIDKTQEIPPKLAALKVKEAIELLLLSNPDFKNLLFDFSEPHKIDLEEFMNKNFMFNVSVDAFARLTGRSLSGFKRDFSKIFQMTPRQWLKEKRLKEAYYLIKTEIKNLQIFILIWVLRIYRIFILRSKKKFGMTTTEV